MPSQESHNGQPEDDSVESPRVPEADVPGYRVHGMSRQFSKRLDPHQSQEQTDEPAPFSDNTDPTGKEASPPRHTETQAESSVERSTVFGTLKKAVVYPRQKWKDLPMGFRIARKLGYLFTQGLDERNNKAILQRALEQHAAFLDVLEREGVELVENKGKKGQPFSRIYTADLGAVVDDELLFAQLHGKRREEAPMQEALNERLPNAKKYGVITGRESQEMYLRSSDPDFHPSLEGGDIIYNNNHVFVGLGVQSNEETISSFARGMEVRGKVVHVIRHRNLAHLDCAMTILPSGECVVGEEAVEEEGMQKLREFFGEKLIVCDRKAPSGGYEWKKYLSMNIVFLNPRKAIIPKGAGEIRDLLHSRGIETIELENDALVKFGGSFRCLLMDLVREG